MRLSYLTRLGLLGCMALSSSARAQPAEDQAISELREHHRHHHHGGVTQLIAMSLDTLGEDEAKRPQVEKLQSALHTCTAPAREHEKALLGILAEGVAAGAVDSAKVDATISQLNAAATAVHDCSVTTLNELHQLLSPAERAALADKVQAHWGIWKQVNHEAPAGGREEGGRLAELSRELSLTPDQMDKMSSALQSALAGLAGTFDHEKARGHVQAFASAFSSDAFDAKAIGINANGMLASHGARRMAVFYETVTPLLTAEQRATLAQHLREHASHQPSPSAT